MILQLFFTKLIVINSYIIRPNCAIGHEPAAQDRLVCLMSYNVDVADLFKFLTYSGDAIQLSLIL